MGVDKELLESTLKLIEENPNHWNQGDWHCGTSHCFAGFVELQIKKLPLDTTESLSDACITREMAREALGLSDLQADVLFSGVNKLEDLKEIVRFFVASSITDEDVNKNKYFAALSPALSINQIEQLSQDEDCDVRQSIASRDDLPIELASRLVKDSEWKVKEEILSRSNLPIKLVTRLAQDEDCVVRLAISHRSNLPIKLVTQLAQDEDCDVRAAIAERADLTAELVNQLAQDEDCEVRTMIALNSFFTKARRAFDRSRYI